MKIVLTETQLRRLVHEELQLLEYKKPFFFKSDYKTLSVPELLVKFKRENAPAYQRAINIAKLLLVDVPIKTQKLLLKKLLMRPVPKLKTKFGKLAYDCAKIIYDIAMTPIVVSVGILIVFIAYLHMLHVLMLKGKSGFIKHFGIKVK